MNHEVFIGNTPGEYLKMSLPLRNERGVCSLNFSPPERCQ